MAESVASVASNPAADERPDFRCVERIVQRFGEGHFSSDVSDIRRRSVGGRVDFTRGRGFRRPPHECDVSPSGDDNCTV